MNNLILKNNKGFTIVESLVAIALLLIAIVAPMTYLRSNLKGLENASNKTKASFLAQEPIEVIKSEVRTNNLDPDSSSWIDGALGLCGGSGCSIDTTSGSIDIVSCTEGCPFLYETETASGARVYGHIQYQNSEQTKFRRQIRISETFTNQELFIYSEMKYGNGDDIFVGVWDLIYNWDDEFVE